MMAIAPPVIRRSRRNVFSTSVSIMRSMRNAALRQAKPANVSVAVIGFELHWTDGLRFAPAHLGRQEFETFIQIDANAMFGAGDRIANRFCARAHDTVDIVPGPVLM